MSGLESPSYAPLMDKWLPTHTAPSRRRRGGGEERESVRERDAKARHPGDSLAMGRYGMAWHGVA